MPKAYADAYTFDGKLVGMCQGAAFSTMFYNMDILNEAGWDTVPTCWDELIQCCKDIKEKTGVAPLVTAAGKHTTCWMIYELILANVAGEELGNYEDDFKNGTFDFTKYPEATARLQEIAPYFLEGTASALEEDAATYMSDGLAAMCLAGNWNGGMILGSLENGAASLPPFGAAGQTPYISTSPEDALRVEPRQIAAVTVKCEQAARVKHEKLRNGGIGRMIADNSARGIIFLVRRRKK